MRSILRGFLAWLDARFPEKVVVTQAEFLKMKADVENMSKAINEKRLEKIEQEINKFNVAMGFGKAVVNPGVTVPFQR